MCFFAFFVCFFCVLIFVFFFFVFIFLSLFLAVLILIDCLSPKINRLAKPTKKHTKIKYNSNSESDDDSDDNGIWADQLQNTRFNVNHLLPKHIVPFNHGYIPMFDSSLAALNRIQMQQGLESESMILSHQQKVQQLVTFTYKLK